MQPGPRGPQAEERGAFRLHPSHVLYLSQEEPRQAIGVDAGEGLIFRYDEATERLVGLTIVGLAQRSAGR